MSANAYSIKNYKLKGKKDSEICLVANLWHIYAAKDFYKCDCVCVSLCVWLGVRVCVSLGVCANCNKCFIWPQQLQIKTKNNATRDVRNEQQKHDNNNNYSCNNNNKNNSKSSSNVFHFVSVIVFLCVLFEKWHNISNGKRLNRKILRIRNAEELQQQEVQQQRAAEQWQIQCQSFIKINIQKYQKENSLLTSKTKENCNENQIEIE